MRYKGLLLALLLGFLALVAEPLHADSLSDQAITMTWYCDFDSGNTTCRHVVPAYTGQYTMVKYIHLHTGQVSVNGNIGLKSRYFSTDYFRFDSDDQSARAYHTYFDLYPVNFLFDPTDVGDGDFELDSDGAFDGRVYVVVTIDEPVVISNSAPIPCGSSTSTRCYNEIGLQDFLFIGLLCLFCLSMLLWGVMYSPFKRS